MAIVLFLWTNNSSSFWQRTFNRGLDPKYRELGLNANPWKIGICGLCGGFFGALCGVGGGIVMIPLLYVAMVNGLNDIIFSVTFIVMLCHLHCTLKSGDPLLP